ncbi:MAG: flagellar biosynthesis protein FlhB [Clostridium sp.]|nr:flagellar biosynthesis protein FlhB [Clostridium sp.]
MAGGGGGGEKTEKPTSKRRQDARKEGNIFQSKDAATVVILFGVFCGIKVFLPFLQENIEECLNHFISRVSWESPMGEAPQIFLYMVITILKCTIPLLMWACLLGILAHGVQTRFNVSFESVKPKMSKLNPISGIKKMFALRNLVELVKNLIKISLLLALLYQPLKKDMVEMSRLLDMSLMASTAFMMKAVFDLVIKVCGAFTVVAFFDFLYQRWEYEKNLKMTKQEVKDEYKQTEGNPEIKGRIRRIQRQMALSRMMQKVPQADVIVRNPTHFAIALKYDPKRHGAPVVLAKGQDELALRIVRAGEENGVFIIENKPLARALYGSCKLDREIPAEFYGAVAEILVLIYRAGHREDMFR